MSTAKTKFIKHLGTGMAGLALLLVIVGAVNMIVANLRLRFDLTEEKLYTLSDGSRQVLGKIKDEVVLKLYISESSPDMPISLKTYAKQVRDLLREYEVSGKGMIRLEQYDAKPDSDAEEWAQRYGIEPQQANPFGSPVYFGLVAVSGENEAAIPGFSPRTEETLEYDVTRLITRVAWPEKPVIGILSSLPVLDKPQNPMMMDPTRRQARGWTAFRELRTQYTLREIPAEAETIDTDVKTLVVVHPKELPDTTLLAIDQFVLRGGRLIALVDPFSIVDFQTSAEQNPMMMMQAAGGARPSTLGKLFDAWGVGFDTSKVVADLDASTSLNNGRGGVEENPAFLSLDKKHMADKDILTAQLSQVMLPFAGSLAEKKTQGLVFSPLMTTTEDACLVNAMSLQMGMEGLKNQLAPDGVKHVLAARVQGEFTTAFPNGVEGAETNAVSTLLKSGKSAVVVFADSDFLYDPFCVQVVNSLFGQLAQPINENLTLFGNTVEQLAGREELIGVRSRGRFSRPFAKVDDLEVRAMKKWQAEAERLEAALSETEDRLAELQRRKTGSERLLLSKEQQDEIERFRETQAQTRRQLKEVRKNLYRDIESLGLRLKVVNIILVPLAVMCFGLVRGLTRRSR